MREQHNSTSLEVGDEVLLESIADVPAASLHGTVSSLQSQVLWVKPASGKCPTQFAGLPTGHPIRLSSPRACSALVGETTFMHCLTPANRLVAVKRPEEMRMVDRRAGLRIPIRHPLGIRVARDSLAGDGGNFGLGMTHDLSAGGLRFETTLHMAVGDHVFVSLVLRPGHSIYALARIVRLDDPPARPEGQLPPMSPFDPGRRRVLAGACFEAISKQDSSRLDSLLAEIPAFSLR